MKKDAKEVENLLKYGAYAFIDNDEAEEEKNQFNKNIDEILASGKSKEFTYNKGVYTLQKSSFNASLYEKLPNVNDPDFWNKVLPFQSFLSITALEKKFKKEKKEIGKSEKLQKEFIKDLEIVVNDFLDAKFDENATDASKKQVEQDQEKISQTIQKLIRLSGLKLVYVEKSKEWLRELLRTNKRTKKKEIIEDYSDLGSQQKDIKDPMEDEYENYYDEDDVIIDYSDDKGNKGRSLRKRSIK
mmetsp:Transcript_43494/g.41960  ORF Transcript_43494/g.41960 Transcript_43494/m.41960 type:complete len:243 (-) Transcript_43494:453-1181(-)|eukprot:CAMPEP_0170560062 /NCGR_PEP_ID=MMETSP0211-20121228/46781_1 /TAXON_ID=311385 /ORGANISM="Pseudokeronopsis sp., Strain OXSARD2" /LENGTH=242 /DNA_ID=CAMNT_0010873831 /DNA_START=319 /DNA_END=1047 /DNA_ORIENTATION=-